jgi:hypothetical protein
LRREVQIALLRNENTAPDRAVDYARSMPPRVVREILRNSKLPAGVRNLVLKDLRERERT